MTRLILVVTFASALVATAPSSGDEKTPCVTTVAAGKGVTAATKTETRTTTQIVIERGEDGKPREKKIVLAAVVTIPLAWESGSTLGVEFTDKEVDAAVAAKVAGYIREWERHVNLRFVIVPPGRQAAAYGLKRAHIRIAFDPKKGHNSQVGKNSLDIEGPSMNLAITSKTDEKQVKRVVLHEFGHAIGFQHEHQNPRAGIKWNEEKVIQYYKDYEGWDEKKTRFNILNKLEEAGTEQTEFDGESIMLYPINKDLTQDGYGVGWNRELSKTDIRAAGLVYPDFADKVCGALVRVAPGYLPEGVVLKSVNPKSPFRTLVRTDDARYTGELEPGDLITEINGRAIRSTADYEAAIVNLPNRFRLQARDVNSGKFLRVANSLRNHRSDSSRFATTALAVKKTARAVCSTSCEVHCR